MHWQGLVSLFCENLRPLLLARFLRSIEFRFRLKQAKIGIGGVGRILIRDGASQNRVGRILIREGLTTVTP